MTTWHNKGESLENLTFTENNREQGKYYQHPVKFHQHFCKNKNEK